MIIPFTSFHIYHLVYYSIFAINLSALTCPGTAAATAADAVPAAAGAEGGAVFGTVWRVTPVVASPGENLFARKALEIIEV